MSPTVWSYITTLLHFASVTTCLGIAQASRGQFSHDTFTRMLHSDWSGQSLLEHAVRTLFTVSGGYLLLDDTVLDKSYSRHVGQATWCYCSKRKKVVFGIPVVMLVWRYKEVCIPIAYRVYQKGGSSKTSLALELISYARNSLKLKPEFVIFDSYYSSKKICKRIRSYGWYFICQLRKNRKFEGQQLKRYRKQPYWHDTGQLSGGLKVQVVKHGHKYFCTNRLSLSATAVRKLYKQRQGIEEVFKFLKSKLGVECCQVGYCREKWGIRKKSESKAQEHHMVLCLVAYVILERERINQGISIRKLRMQLILERNADELPALIELMKVA